MIERMNTRMRVMCVTGIFLLLLTVVGFKKIPPVNVTLVGEFSGVPERANAVMHVETEQGAETDIESHILEGEGVFRIDPKYYRENDIKGIGFAFEESEGRFEKISLYTGKQTGTRRLLKSIDVDKDIAEAEGEIVLTQETVDAIAAGFSNDGVMKGGVIAALVLLYLVVLGRITVFRRIRRHVYMFYVGAVIVYLAGFFYFFYEYEDISVADSPDIPRTEASDILEKDVVYKQTFIAALDGMNGINIDFSAMDAASEGKVAYYIVDEEKDETVSYGIVSMSNLNAEHNVEVSFEKQKNSADRLYSIQLAALDDSGNFAIGVNSASAYMEGQFFVDDVQDERAMAVAIRYDKFDYKIWVWGIITFFCLFTCGVLNYKQLKINAKALILCIYAIMFIYAVGRMSYYHDYVGKTPDEQQHIAYVAYLEANPGQIIPEFENMKQFAPNSEGERVLEGQTNYLGHPPLYYHILRAAGGITVDNGVIDIHYRRMLLVSVMMVLAAIMIMFGIGYKQISRQVPMFHLLYAAIITGVPMFLYNSSGINNDALSLLGITIFFWGLLRYSENNTKLLTYMLVAIGLNITLLSKVTAGIMVILTTVLYVGWTMIKEKSMKSILCRNFFLSLPVYMVSLVYFIMVYIQTSGFQPKFERIDPQGYYDSGFYTDFVHRSIMSAAEYIKYFLDKFFQTWSGISSHVSLVKPGDWYEWNSIGFSILWLLPLLLFIVKMRKDSKKIMLWRTAVISIYITVILQYINAYNAFFFLSGYMGGFQSRYYLCIIIVFAFIPVYLLEYIYKHVRIRASVIEHRGDGDKSVREHNITQNIVVLASVVLFALIIYNDFIYFLLNFRRYL